MQCAQEHVTRNFQPQERDRVNKVAITGWALLAVGTIVWIYGYFVTGHMAYVDWHTYTPWWIADYLPNIESEIGMVMVCVGSGLTYWPSRK